MEKSLILVSGKGGSGKTHTVGRLAQVLTTLKKKVLIVESTPMAPLARFFGHKADFDHGEVPLGSGLFYLNIDPKKCFEEYVVSHLGMGIFYQKILRHKMVASFLEAIPGLGETMLLGRLFHACELGQMSYDHVIFDGPAFGHFLTLLTTPEGILDTKISGPLVQEVNRVQNFLKDPKKTGILLSCVSESLILSETLEFIEKIRSQTSVSILGVVIQKVPAPASFPPSALENKNLIPIMTYIQTKNSIMMDQLEGFKKSLFPLPFLVFEEEPSSPLTPGAQVSFWQGEPGV
jgi:anion-transporting  ArsA/GET3 family ATPase